MRADDKAQRPDGDRSNTSGRSDAVCGKSLIAPRTEQNGFIAEHRLLMPNGSVKYVQAVAHRCNRRRSGEGILHRGGNGYHRAQARRTGAREIAPAGGGSRAHQPSEHDGRTCGVAGSRDQAADRRGRDQCQACLRWLQREPPELEQARETLSRIINDAQRSASIIDRNRSLYGGGAPQREPIDLNEVIREMVVMFRDTASRHRDFDPQRARPSTSNDNGGSCAIAAGLDEPHAQWYRGDAGREW